MFFLFDLRVTAILGGTSMRVIDTAFSYYVTWHGEKSRGTEFKPCVAFGIGVVGVYHTQN